LGLYFPKEFRNVEEVEYNVELINKMQLEVSQVLEESDENVEREIFDSEKRLLLKNTPNIWNVNTEGNSEIEMEVDFEKFMIAISEHTNENIDDISVFRFYVIVEFIKEKSIKNG